MLCGVTVRTVQYYDSRNILSPSRLSEGGRRLYSQENLRKLKVLCFLPNPDLSINSIADLFQEKNSEKVIPLLLQQQEDALRNEIRERQETLQTLSTLSRYYFDRVANVCPECHKIFFPTFRQVLFARHTPTLRRLTCTECGCHGFCIETCRPTEKE